MECYTFENPDLEAIARGRVVVAMSGGVDSSVVAAKLHAEGQDVVGISMRLYSTTGKTPGKSCCSPDDLLDARSVASAFGFPFYVANYEDEFQKYIIDYFTSEYKKGRTPSPCVVCNNQLKFGPMLERMKALGGRYLATGHYARIVEIDGRSALLRGVDCHKDQSYFLFGLKREVLPYIRFPLGELTKPEVRELALKLGVPTATKRESQDLCFVPDGQYADFVEKRLSDDELRPGRFILSSNGEVLGEHEGIHRYTVGQRKGLGIAYSEPLYVQSIDPDTGDIFVAVRDDMNVQRFTVEGINWQRWETPPEEFEADIQVRYRHHPVRGRVICKGKYQDEAVVELYTQEKAVTPGQAAVFYDGDEVLGGGWMSHVKFS